MTIDEFERMCNELKEVIIKSYDWTGESSFEERLEKNLSENPKLREFYYANFRDI